MTSIEIVFNALRGKGTMKRAEIVALTKLNRDTVGTALARLVQLGYLKRGGGRQLKREYTLLPTAITYSSQRIVRNRPKQAPVMFYGKDQPFLLGECWKNIPETT